MPFLVRLTVPTSTILLTYTSYLHGASHIIDRYRYDDSVAPRNRILHR